MRTHTLCRRFAALVILLLTTIGTPDAHAQEAAASAGTIDGTIVDRQTRRPVEAAAVMVEGSDLTAVSDATGRFRIDHVPAGTHVLRVEAAGYAVLSQADVQVTRGRVSVIALELSAAPTSSFSDRVTVKASAFEQPPGVTTTSYGVAYAEVRRSAGAIGDLNRHLQSLPGISPSTNGRNDIVARVGSPSENLTLVDGIEVPNLNHFSGQGTSGGAISMLNTELLSDATFLAGGFPARFGNRLSSVLDIRLREGNRDRFETETDVSFAGASIVAEGPMGFGSESGSGSGVKGSWIASVRRSYLELLKSSLDLHTVPEYGSYQAKMVYDLNASNRIWLLGIGGYDRFNYKVDDSDLKDPSLLNIDDSGKRFVQGFGWQQLFGTRGYGRLTVSDNITQYGATVHDQQVDNQLTFHDNSRDEAAIVGYDVALRFGRQTELQTGVEARRMQSDIRIVQPIGVPSRFSADPGRVDPVDLDKTIVAWLTSGYAQLTTPVAPRTRLTFGVRADRFDYLDATRASPRAGLSIDLTSQLTASVSAGRYYQQPELVYLGADPVNRFLKPIRADHFVGGIAYVPSPDLKLSVEAYQKNYADYPVSVEYPMLSLANIGDQESVAGLLVPMTSQGRGRARGIEVFLQKKLTGAMYGQVSYSYSKVRHAALDGIFRPGGFDSPHTLATILGYRLGPRWEMSTRFTFATGRPYTPALLDASYAQNRWIDDLSRVNAARLPDFQRLDLRVDRKFQWGRTNVSFYLEAQNIYNRKNAIAFDWNAKTNQPHTQKQLGLLPVFGITVEF